MKLAIFVHELYLVGHSNATIEIVRNLPKNAIDELHIVALESDDPEMLFPNFQGRIYIHRPIFKITFPFLLKEIFFQFYSLWTCLFLKHDVIRLSVGSCSLVSDIINIQFISTQWEPYYFKMKRFSPLSLLYKKILFLYLRFSEKLAYTNQKKYLMVARFIDDYARKKFHLDQENTDIVYSSVNIDRFHLEEKSRFEIYNELREKYPQLSTIDVNRPIILFVGAYERKGLSYVLDSLEKDMQIIIVGSPEVDGSIDVENRDFTIAKVNFTKEVQKFYALCDLFAFPTSYEPFGLVLFEAAAMGIRIISCKKNVGASEIMEGLEGVEFLDGPEDFTISNLEILSFEQRKKWREKRLPRLTKYSWVDGAAVLQKFCKSFNFNS